MNLGEAIHLVATKLSIWFRWVSLRSLSNSYATRSAILIPLVGYLLLFNGTVSKWLEIAAAVGGNPTSHDGISTRLLLIYFGLCFIALANTLYGFFCPPEIKEYPSASSYIVGDGDSIRTTALGAIESRLLQSDFKHKIDQWQWKYQGGFEHEDSKAELLRMHFDFLNSRHRSIRITSAIAYIIGFFCLGISSLQVFFSVTGLLLKDLLG